MTAAAPSDLSQACRDLGHWLCVAESLLAQADELPTESMSSTPFSRPPWNQAVASALFDAHAAIRELEAEMRLEATGTVRRWSPRSGNTGEVLAAIAAMESAVTRPLYKRAIRDLTRRALHIRQLPAVDDALRWERLRSAADGLPPVCPWCKCYSLKVAIQAGLVACWNDACFDDDGERPQGRLDVSRLDGTPIVDWS